MYSGDFSASSVSHSSRTLIGNQWKKKKKPLINEINGLLSQQVCHIDTFFYVDPTWSNLM